MTTYTGRQKEQTTDLSQQTCEQGREETNSFSSALIGRLGGWTRRIQSIVSNAFDATVGEGGRGLSRGVAGLSGPFPFCVAQLASSYSLSLCWLFKERALTQSFPCPWPHPGHRPAALLDLVSQHLGPSFLFAFLQHTRHFNQKRLSDLIVWGRTCARGLGKRSS